MRRMKKILSAFMALITIAGLSGCSNEDFEEISDFITVNTGIQSNNILNKNAAEQYQTAIINGNIEWMKEIVAANPDLDVNYTSEMTAMYCACWESHEPDYYKAKMIEALLEVGVDPNIGDPLQLTTYNKKYYLTEALLKSDSITLDTTNSLGSTPLSMAMENSDGGYSIDGYKQVLLMLEAGATSYPEMFYDQLEEDAKGSHFKNVDISPVSTKLLMNMLLESGQSSGLKPALQYAFSGQIDKCLDELRKNDINGYNYHEMSVLTNYAAYYGNAQQYDEIIGYTKIYLKPDFICHLVESGNLEMVKHLSEIQNIPYNGEECTRFITDALDYAAIWGYSDICQYLCEQNIDIKNFSTIYPALNNAILSEDLDTVKVIYNYINQKIGIKEIDIGRAYKNYKFNDIEKAKSIVDFFFSEGYNLSCVEFYGCDKEFAEYLYKQGRPIAPTDLTYAVRSNDKEYVKMVLDKGADPNQNAFEKIDRYPWNISYDINNIIVEDETGYGVEYDVSYNKFCEYYKVNFDNQRFGNAMLSTAIKYCNSEIVQLLIDYGADLSLNDYFVDCRYASKATVKVLIEAGANTDIKYLKTDYEGGVGLSDFFKYYKRDDLAELLKEYK